jgi:XRN 5'-3' exonuclease N-terminus
VPARAQDSYAHVCFDLNQVCHQAARRASDLQSVAKLIFREIDATLKVACPTKSIFFAIDGPAPTAKLLTQRRRRSKEALKAPKPVAKPARLAESRTAAAGAISVLDDERKPSSTALKRRRKANGASSSSAVPAVHAIDRILLTPGIDLMHDIAAAVEYYAYVRLQSNSRFAHLDIRISGPDVPGEGELKIFDFLNSKVAASSPVLPAHESAIIIGSDADIVLQALATTSMQNLFVFFRGSNAEKTEWAKRTNTILSVWKIACRLHQLFPSDSLTVRLDLIIMSICSGNDYIPKLRGVTIPRLWKRYNRLRRGSAVAESEFAGGLYREDEKPEESAAQRRNRMKLAAVRRASEAAEDEASGLPFAHQTLVDPVRRTFNWPFLCALVDNVGARVPEITSQSLQEGRLASEAHRPSLASGIAAAAASVKLKSATELAATAAAACGDNDDDVVLYTGDEAGVTSMEGMVERETSDSEEDDESDEEVFDEYEDENSAHIETLISISGSSGKYFDTVEWLRTLLFTLQMYIDGFCPDYYYAYTKRYAPSSRVLADFIRAADGDPHPVEAPVSASAPLTPLKAGFAMLPRTAAHYLPLPYQSIARNDAMMREIFPSDDIVCFDALNRVLDAVPAASFTSKQKARLDVGHVLHMCRPSYLCPMSLANKLEIPERPGSNFLEPQSDPPVLMRLSSPTRSPPCLPWPTGVIPGMLSRPTRQNYGRGRRGSLSGRGRGSRGGYQPRGRGGSSVPSGRPYVGGSSRAAPGASQERGRGTSSSRGERVSRGGGGSFGGGRVSRGPSASRE